MSQILKKLPRASVVFFVIGFIFFVVTVERQMALNRAMQVVKSSYEKMVEAYSVGDQEGFEEYQGYVVLDHQDAQGVSTARNAFAVLMIVSVVSGGGFLLRERRKK